MRFPDGSALGLTVARYYTPTGRSIQRPYENGKKEYYHDFSERFQMNGELEYKDSIKFDDSQKFITPGEKYIGGASDHAGCICPGGYLRFLRIL